MNLDPDLQRILNIGAKVYEVESKRQGRIISLDDNFVVIDYGNNVKSNLVEYETPIFKQKLVNDEIVSNSRLSIGSNNAFKVNPRQGVTNAPSQVKKPASTSKSVNQSKEQKLETGYINFKTGRFSEEPKKGYIKVEYKKSTQKVTLEIDDEALEKLKEMGLM